MVGLDIGSEVGHIKIAEGGGITEEEIEREIASMRACLEHNTQTNTTGNVHLDRELRHSSLPAERSVARETRNDNWMSQETALPRRPQVQVNLPPVRLELFDGDCC